MTNETNYKPCRFKCNGATKDFPFDFQVHNYKNKNELIVNLINTETQEATLLVEGVDYTTTLETVGGNVITTTAYADIYEIVISRKTSHFQGKSFSTSGGFQASEIESAFDRVSCSLQDMDYNIETFKEEYSEETNQKIEGFEKEVNLKIETNRQEIFDIQQGYELEVNEKIQIVAEAADKINTLDNTIESIKRIAEDSVKVNEDTRSKIIENEQTVLNILTRTEEVTDEAKETVLNILTRTEEVADEAKETVSSTLKKNQITNCLLEVPQRIKYDLTDGILTIKAGSVVIVPYGVEDLTSQYPVGSTFINDNFKVYDTQFADNKFFVWAEVVEDIVGIGTTTDTTTRQLCIDLSNKSCRSFALTGSGDDEYTGTSNYVLYHTSENVIKFYNKGVLSDIVYALPIGVCTADGTHYVGVINQIFNGMGYIGSTVWVDKGVKGLIPNGRNDDGSLNNIEVITSKFQKATETVNNSNINKSYILLTNEGGLDVRGMSGRYYDSESNYFIIDGAKYSNAVIATKTYQNSATKSLTIKQPFRAVDYNDVDGQWVQKYLSIMSKVTAIGSYTYDLSEYLPNDGFTYEVMFDSYMNSGNTTYFTIGTKASPHTNRETCFYYSSVSTAEGRVQPHQFFLPIDSSRKVYIQIASAAISVTSHLHAVGYRRIGTNV